MADTSLSPRRLAYLAGVRRQKRRVRIWQLALLIGLFGFWEDVRKAKKNSRKGNINKVRFLS